MVIWLIGLSGSGKSTLANEIVSGANKKGSKTILLDGDVIREVFDNDLSHSMSDRLINARRICKLGQFLDKQGVNVVVAILSLFQENRDWNRKNLKNYFEVFIDCPIADLVKRDPKGLYRKFAQKEISDVAGMDINFDKPHGSDLVIDNSGSLRDLMKHTNPLIKKLVAAQ